MKWRIRGIFSTESLMRILLRLKCSCWCGALEVSNGGSRRPPVVEKEVLGFGWYFGEEESEKSYFSC